MMRPTTERRSSTLLSGAQTTNLVLNTSKTKEVIVDYRRSRMTEHAPLLIHREAVERVNNIKFLGIHITSDLTWSMNTAHLIIMYNIKEALITLKNLASLLLSGLYVMSQHSGQVLSCSYIVQQCEILWFDHLGTLRIFLIQVRNVDSVQRHKT
ncbi:hypothetical protein L3Q82_005248 [Scortum barcoo]|uniref:Uncharacterized protein n=1 Tax=Scortum barcoo TaxID=214431 RepID=A0ACB8V9Y8_9TELE|nr:hypothetical protein L3Q82_005248 [Scortum barcoo]